MEITVGAAASITALLSGKSGVYGLVVHSRLVAVSFEASDPGRAARFWAALLGREVVEDAAGALLAGADGQLGLRFVAGRAGQLGANRMHLHLTSADLDDQKRMVAMALELGGRHLDVGQRPEDEHVVLADPAGYEFCVIEPGNAYLAGCGLLGELACDGTREVGLFWSKALGWPLVWDQDEETAIQSPRGGTKIAWGGPPVAPKEEPNRQRFELIVAAGEQQAAADDLISLGATRIEIGEDGAIVLADPDGNEFSVSVGTPIEVRRLARADLSRVAEIDRTERIDLIYVQDGTALEERRGDWSSPAWEPRGHGEHTVDAKRRDLEQYVDSGGIALGAFAEGRLAGIGVVVPHLRPGIAQLAFLHVSAAFRATGVGRRLSDELDLIARAAGDTEIVVSATPSANTVRFYLGRGYEPTAEALPELFELEPDDVHLGKAL
ncbi:GNAT family N-acetyltransferase [Paractinoplanes globisporus]|uniref:GNAT family N-acetyltransferase n=1 Tax=Paractinoplanes globisporus TaxID=113565 RepID=A0ABW6WT37_9ACTN|nr:GNAT family N-acetyltransferase [Actinoplanes globisporus]